MEDQPRPVTTVDRPANIMIPHEAETTTLTRVASTTSIPQTRETTETPETPGTSETQDIMIDHDMDPGDQVIHPVLVETGVEEIVECP